MVCPFTTTLTPYVRSIIFDYRIRLLARPQCATRAIRAMESFNSDETWIIKEMKYKNKKYQLLDQAKKFLKNS